jgi:hypothetical protein
MKLSGYYSTLSGLNHRAYTSAEGCTTIAYSMPSELGLGVLSPEGTKYAKDGSIPSVTYRINKSPEGAM